MSRLTPLESAVMDAMVWQMGDSVPDLSVQAAASSPGVRRNTGAGLYSQFVVDANRQAANPDATGLFGTVHVMVADLPDPIGFQIELRQGRLMALHGQSYGQDTRAIDFATTPFGEVFTVDARGQSIIYRPAWRAPDLASPEPKATARPTPPAQPRPQPQAPQRSPVPPVAKPSEHPLPSAAAPTLTEMFASASNPTASRAGKLVLVYLGAYALGLMAILIVSLILHTGLIFGLVAAGLVLRYIHGQKGRVMMSDFADRLDREGVFEALKPN